MTTTTDTPDTADTATPVPGEGFDLTRPVYDKGGIVVHHGDCLDVLAAMPDESVDAVVTDPPYGLEFMGKDWDSFRTDERVARWAGGNSGGAGSITASHLGDGVPLPNYTRSRTTAQCQTCGKRDAFRNPHGCDDTGRVDGIPMEMRAFGNWCHMWATELHRVLKPGGHVVAFGGTRTWHRLAVAIEEAGFDIRDSLAWLYASGFPKSMDVSKAIDKAAGVAFTGRPAEGVGFMNPEGRDGYNVTKQQLTREGESTPEAEAWQGWGTALKPAFEPIVLARKPLIGTVAQNVLTHGTGALNVDGCRTEMSAEDRGRFERGAAAWAEMSERRGERLANGELRKPAEVYGDYGTDIAGVPHDGRRWPANIALDPHQATELDTQSGTSTSPSKPVRQGGAVGYRPGDITDGRPGRNGEGIGYGDEGGASRYFLTATPDEPLEDGPEEPAAGDDLPARFIYQPKAPGSERPRVNGVAHPTVKPLTLMRWLVRLVTPPGGTVLEPFGGSGTTAEAALLEGMECVVIERDADYLPLIRQRLDRRRDPVAAVRAAGGEGGLFDLLTDDPDLDATDPNESVVGGSGR